MKKTSYYGNSWIGMFACTNNEHTFVPVDSDQKFLDALKGNLQTECTKISIAGSNILGLYIVMNSTGLVVPNVVEEKEVELLKKTGLNVYVSEDIHNANGNNIVVNDKGGIISQRISREEIKKIEDVMGVEMIPLSIAKYSTVGSVCITTNKGFLAHYACTDDGMKVIESALKVPGNKGTMNMVVGFVSLGVIANEKSYVVGELTTAFEMGRLEESLGFLND